MKHRFIAVGAAALLATLIAGCATNEDANYASTPSAMRENPTGSRIPRIRRATTEQERRQAQEDAQAMREGALANGLANQGR